jgi:hypothetical protein
VPCGYIKAFESLMKIAISKENTFLRPELEFTLIVRMEIWPTGATKDSKSRIIWLNLIETFQRYGIGDNLARGMIDEKSGGNESLILEFQRHMCLGNER